MLMTDRKNRKVDWGNFNCFYNASFLAISKKSWPPEAKDGVTPEAGSDARRVWGVYGGGVVVESTFEEWRLLELMNTDTPYAFVDDKPYTMPNGERNHQDQAKGR